MLQSDTLILLEGKFVIGLLFFIRIFGLFAAAPFFGNPKIIPHVKIYLAFFLAVMLTSSFWKEQPAIDFHLWNLIGLAFKEFLTGLALGFSAHVVFWAANLAGGLIDFDMGYQAATMFDPQNANPSLVGEFKNLVVLMIFLIIDGHHYLIQGLFASVRAVPITTFELTTSSVRLFTNMAASVMIIGLKMAAPVIVSLFLTNLGLTLLARVAPQTNIFSLSFQAKIAVGLLVLLATMPLFIFVAKYSLASMENEIMKLLLSLNPGRV
ncbi:MAG: flagellar biosynthetic protein FliR [Ignavibacteria bacterium]|nr:flagellar biosynthetic protein FliR [Ignavibacteria bacterium]